jgi:type 1 glutamine amidotransferase
MGFHSAPDTFHSKEAEVDPYIAMIGGEFLTHGAQQEASLALTSKFPGIGQGISLTDEWYAFRNFAPDLHVILLQETQRMEGEPYRRPNYPATWARMHGKGRVFYTSLGHREDVWTNPLFQTLALGGLSWSSGRVDADIKPNIDKVAPLANQLRPA